jgi:hypothetical protein
VAKHEYYDVTETVHYGYWGHMSWTDELRLEPVPAQQFTRVVTLPREGESQTSVERDPVRASWPHR